MNKRRKFLAALFSILILPVLVFFAMTRNALALDEASINAKATFEGVYQCFNSGAYASSWKATELFSSFVTNAGNSDAVKLPYKKTNADNNNLNCDEVMLGQGHKASSGVQGGLLTDSARKTSEASSVAKYFAGNSLDGNGGLGYDATSDVGAITGNGKKLTYSITSNNTCYNSSAKPTLSLNGGSISEIVFPTIANSDNKITINNTGINVPVPGSKETYTYEACDHTTIKITDEGDSSSIKYRVSASGSGTYESSGMEWLPYSRFTITAKTTKDGVEYSADNFNTGSQMNITLSPNVSTEYESTSSYSNEYTLNRIGNVMSFLKGVNNNNRLGYNVSNLYSGYNYLALTRQEVYDLYKYYANDVLHMQITCEGDSDYTSYENGGATINWKGGGKRCVIKNNGNTIPDDLYGVDDSYHFTAKITSVDDIRKTLNSLGDLCNPKLNGVEGCDGSSSSSSSGSTSSSDRYKDGFCDEAVDEDGGIGSMQWILCPTLDNTTYTANWIDNLAEKYLEVDPGMYANEELKGKWEIIRNITNIAMVVFFMIIIGSQITGYGIDNYGIKKMLPRLIVMAIIINLSFYICTLAIDVSNILGEGLRGLFGAGSDGGTDGFVNVIMGLFGIGATGGAAAAGAATTAITLFGGGWIVLVIAVIVLVVVVIAALVVLLIMLGAREVIIVFCVISSPLAFAAFILPNTQNIFKKWWELFKAAIIIFPICGFVAGISAMLKDIDSMQMSGWGRLVMVVLPYLVFFLLPLLLKQALAALGKIGGALTAAGSTIKNGGKAVGRGAWQVGKQTEGFKRMQEQAARRKQIRWSDRYLRRHGETKDKSAGDIMAGRIKAAKQRVALTDANTSEGRRARRDLERLQGQALLVDEATKIKNKTGLEQDYADQGGTYRVSDKTTTDRARATRTSQIFKDQFDYFSAPERTKDEINKEFARVKNSYSRDRNDTTEAQLRAMVAVANSREMDDVMHDNLDDLGLSTTNRHDAGVLAQMTGTKNEVISQAGKDLGNVEKTGGRTISLGEYVSGKYAAPMSATAGLPAGSGVSLRLSTQQKGLNAASNLSDDDMKYLQRVNKGAESYDYSQWFNGALNSKNGKQLTQFNNMLHANYNNTNGFEMKVTDLPKITETTFNSLNPSVYAKAVSSLIKMRNTDAGRQIINAMDPNIKKRLGLG